MPCKAWSSWLHARPLSGREGPWPVEDDHGFTESQLLALRLTSLVLGSVSLASTLFATFWFVRRSRSFRHDLVVLLIQSDTLKSVVFIILPVVDLVRGPVASGAATCQASGFLLAVGFEACDVAVVLVALHTALYIFRGRGGLYPYRQGALAVFLAIPLLLASLAFINKPAFVNSGRYCHLPSRPRWASFALSWIPRYVILVTICLTYASTYVYVQILMSRFGAACGGERLQAARRCASDEARPPMPPIADHGLALPTTPPREDPGPVAEGSHMFPAASMAADGHTMAHRGWSHDQEDRRALVDAAWKTARPGADPVRPPYRQQRRALSNLELTSRQTMLGAATRSARVHSDRSGRAWTHLTDRTSPPSSWSCPLLASAPAKMSGPWTETQSPRSPSRVLRLGTYSLNSSTRGASQAPAALATPPGLTKMRNKIRRQLRQLFIYPAVYMVVWLIPFISHAVDSASRKRPSFALAVTSLASLCVQGFADALVFSLLEKPWRHPRHVASSNGALLWRWSYGRGGRVGSPGRGGTSSFMPCWPVLSTVEGHAAGGAGRTRDEMLADSRAARLRRDEELAERRMLRRTAQAAAEAPRREWWDVGLGSLDDWDDDIECNAEGSRTAVASYRTGLGRGPAGARDVGPTAGEARGVVI